VPLARRKMLRLPRAEVLCRDYRHIGDDLRERTLSMLEAVRSLDDMFPLHQEVA
jgi:hypothetical protein